MRSKFVARLLILLVFAVLLGFDVLRSLHLAIGSVSHGRKDLVAKKESSHLIRKSVLLGYGDKDPLVIFAVHRHANNITIILASYGYLMRPLFCRFFDEQHHEASPAVQTLVFPEFTMHCPTNDKAKFVAVTLNYNDAVSTFTLHKIEQADGQFFFSVCLAPLWGDSPKWLMLIEFMEYYILQGAKHFFIYKQTADALTEAVLDNYAKDGLVEVIDISETTRCLKKHRCRHEMQLQDCVFRARGKSKWVGTVDLDERIGVNNGVTLEEYVRSADETNRGELRFRCRWVLRLSEIPNSPSSWRSERARIPMLVWHNTSHVAPVNHTTKSIIQPEKVEGMSVHQVLRFSPGADVFLVPPEEAVIRSRLRNKSTVHDGYGIGDLVSSSAPGSCRGAIHSMPWLEAGLSILALRHYRHTQGWSFFLKEAETFGDFEHTEINSTLAETLESNVRQVVDRLFPEKHHSDLLVS